MMLRNIKYIVFILLFASTAYGQAQPIRNDTPSNLRDLGSNLSVGRNFSVDQKGQTLIGNITPGVGATALGKAEDAPHVSGDTGVACWSVRQDSAGTPASTTGDYQMIASSISGAVIGDIDFNFQASTAKGIQKVGGGAWVSGNSGIPPLYYREASISTTGVSASDGQYSNGKTSANGALYTQQVAGPSGGATISRTASGASNNSTNVKASAGSVYTVIACNSNAAARYVKLYNKATAPSCGSDTPVATILVPATNCVNLPQQVPLAFGTGIGFCMVTGVADSDNTSVGANDVLLTLGYN